MKKNVLNSMNVAKFTVACLAGFFAFLGNITAQNVQWKKHFGGDNRDYYYAATEVPDGIVAVGSSYFTNMGTGDWDGITGKGGEDAIIVKYSKSGNLIWKTHFGGLSNDFFYGVITVPDGVVAVGETWSSSTNSGDWTEDTGKGGAAIVKFDLNGSVVWKKRFGGDKFNSIVAVSDGLVAVGFARESDFGSGDWENIPGNGGEDAIIVKFNSNGEMVWRKCFGGSGNDHFNSVTAVFDGVVATGYSSESSFGAGDWEGVTGKGGNDAIIVKYDNNGIMVWKNHFGGSDHDKFLGVTTISDGVVAVGYSYERSFGNGDWTGTNKKGMEDAIIVKYYNNGNLAWKKNFGHPSGENWFYDVTTLSDGIAAAGYTYYPGGGDWGNIEERGEDDAAIVKFNNSGNVVWKSHFGGWGDDRFHGVTAVSDGIVAVGYSENLSFYNDGDWEGVDGRGDDDAIIVKFTGGNAGITKTKQETNIKVYPNPTNGQLKIKNYELKEIGVIEIFDVFGRIVVEASLCVRPSEIEQSEIEIDVSQLSSGVYFVKIKTDKGELIEKVIKK